MKKIIYFSFFFILSQLAYSQSIQEIVKNIPEDNITGLASSMVQYLVENTADSVSKTSSYLSNDISRDLLSKDYARLRTSKVGTTEIKILPLINDSKIICVLKTVCGTICDSRIYLFSDKWKQLEVENLTPSIDVEWFLTKDQNLKNTDDYKYVYKLLSSNLPVKYQLSPTDQSLTLTVDPTTFIDKETYGQLKDYFDLTPKILNWNKTSFEEIPTSK